MSFVVATYNVHGFVGTDGRHDLGRVADVIRELDAPLVALQEAVHGDGGLDALAGRLGLPVLEGPTLHDHRGPFGNAILTTLPVLGLQRVDLSVPGREPRGALDLRVEVAGAPVRVVATHLGLARRERRHQIAQLADLLRDEADLPTVLLGDVNEWGWAHRPLRRLRARMSPGPLRRTFPARFPVLPLDRIWVDPAPLLVDARAHATPAARMASDHLPLRAELRVPAVPEPPEGVPVLASA